MSGTPARYEVQADSVPVMQCPVAGFQYYRGESCWARMRPSDLLVLRREPGNRHDARAIAIEWQGVMLGYVPREANYMLSQMMDRGCRVEARVAAMRAGPDPWNRMMVEVAWPAGGARLAPSTAPREDPFQPSEILLRSLGNRIFGGPVPGEASGWLQAHAAALALVGVEKPALLPFLRLVPEDRAAAAHAHPSLALQGVLEAAGIEAGAWRKLTRWGFGSFERLGEAWVKPIPIARLANLLLRLDVQEPPPPEFAGHALTLAYHRTDRSARLDFERYPLWFMRALVRHRGLLRCHVVCAANWFIDTKPIPDANQQHAGWPWIAEKSIAHFKALMPANALPWAVPCGEMTFGQWRVVPIRSAVELAAEAAAMKNCLADYEDDCRAGSYAVFSIRDQLTDERKACFSLTRVDTDEPWELEQIAGKKNAAVGDEMLEVAQRAVAAM